MAYCMYLRKSRSDLRAGSDIEEVLKRHEASLLELAASLGITVDAVYRELVSGENIAGRPMMKRLLAEVESGIWEGVLVMEIERLARGNTIDQGIITQTFHHAKTKIITPMKTYLPDDEYDEEYFEFSLFMSRREYKAINRRMQRGRLATVKEGKYAASRAPYGYRKIKTGSKGFTLTPDVLQSEVVLQMFTRYAAGETAASIAETLNLEGHRTAKGNLWKQNAVLDILKNPVYIGMVRWNNRKQQRFTVMGQLVTHRPHSNEVIITQGLHPAIVPKELFETANERLQKRRKSGQKN